MVRSLIGRVAGVGAIALGLAGCGGHTTNAVLCTVPATSDAGACRYQPDYGYRFDPNKAKEKGKQSLVVVSLSGGGVRASALAYGTLLALGELTGEVSPTLLADVDIISSVSGGSVTAGWYALHGADGLGEGNRLRRFLDDDNMGSLAVRGLNPLALARYLVTDRQRSDVLADYFADRLFDKLTYDDVITRYRKRDQPFVILNSTDLGHETRFPFTQNRFDLICSDLNRYPLAAAVGASANFPLFFSAVGIRNYSDNCPVHDDTWMRNGPAHWIDHYHRLYDAVPVFNPAGAGVPSFRSNGLLQLRAARQAWDYVAPPSDDRFVHLLDGGLVDNLGIQSTLALEDDAVCLPGLFQRLARPRPPAYKDIKEVLFVVVNARKRSPSGIDDTISPPDLPSTMLRVIDTPIDSTILTMQSYLTAQLYAISRWNADAISGRPLRDPSPEELSPRETCFREGTEYLDLLTGRKSVTATAKADEHAPERDLNRAINTGAGFRFRIVSIDFEAIPEVNCRRRFWQLSTSWSLDRQTISDLIQLPRIVLKRSEELRDFYRDLARTPGGNFADPARFPSDFSTVCS